MADTKSETEPLLNNGRRHDASKQKPTNRSKRPGFGIEYDPFANTAASPLLNSFPGALKPDKSYTCNRNGRICKPTPPRTSDATGEEPSTSEAKNIDGEYAWVILVAVFVANLLTVGFAKCLGLIFQILIDHFHGSAASTSIVPSLGIVVVAISGPIASKLSTIVGCRVLVMTGSIILFASYVLTSIVPSLGYAYVTIGLLTGLGIGLIALPVTVILTQYFEEKRARAFGIATIGFGLGSVIFAPLIQIIFDYYGYTGGMLLTGAILLNTCIPGALLRPAPRRDSLLEEQVIEYDVNSENTDESTIKTKTSEATHTSNSSYDEVSTCAITDEVGDKDTCDSRRPHGARNQCFEPNGDIKHPLKTESKVTFASAKENSHTNHIRQELGVGKSKVELSKMTTCDEKAVNPCKYGNTDGDIYSRRYSTRSSILSQSFDDAILRSGFYKAQYGSQISNTSAERRSTIHIPSKFTPHEKLYKNVLFLMFVVNVSGMMLLGGLLFLPSYGIEIGISETASASLISVNGIFDIIGRFIFGFIFDAKFTKQYVIQIHAVLGILLGCSVAAVAIADTAIVLIILTGVQGLFEGVYNSQRVTVLAQLVRVDQVSTSFSYLLVGEGIIGFFGPMMHGNLRDIYGTYKYGFLIGGLVFVVLCLVFLIFSMVYRWNTRRHSICSDKPIMTKYKSCEETIVD